MEGGLATAEVGTLEIVPPVLKYAWRATFKDDSIINQFDGEDDALNFKKVMNFQENLVSFSLAPRKFLRRGHKINVDLTNGVITINGVEFLPYYEDEPLVDVRFKLEYFRRNYDIMEFSGDQQVGKGKSIATYYIGWSTLWKGKNVKRLVRIYFDDKLGIG